MFAEPEKKLAIVTGASSGLGRALCMRFVERGVRVMGVARGEDDLLETGRLCTGSGEFIPVVSDVSDAQAASQVFASLDHLAFDDLILVNNAAIYEHHDLATDPVAPFERAIRINFLGAVIYSHLALQRMVSRGRGRIVNVGSFADIAPLPGSSGYSVSKGALRLFTRALVADTGKRFPGIVVNDWVPGVLNTQMGLKEGLDPNDAAIWGVELALSGQRELSGRIFDMKEEVLPPRSLKRKIAELVGLRPKHVPIRLD